MRGWLAAMAVVAGVAVALPAPAQDKQGPPYFASIAPNRARMRAGPARSYPATWLYVRAGLPVKVVEVYKEWRKIEDPGGTQGWMQGNLLSGTRTGIVHGAIAELRAAPNAGAKVVWRAQPGVVGRLSQCASNWCRFDVAGRAGFIDTAQLWGVAPGEALP